MLSSAGDTDRPMHVLQAAIQTGYCALTLLDMIPCWARCDHDRIFNNCAYYLRSASKISSLTSAARPLRPYPLPNQNFRVFSPPNAVFSYVISAFN